MKAILKDTTNAQMLSQIGKKYTFFENPKEGQRFMAYGDEVDTKPINSSVVTRVANVGNLWRIETTYSIYMFELLG